MTPDELDLLIHRYFQGTVTSDEEGLLWDSLRNDPRAADRFVEIAELESALVESLTAEQELPSGVHAILRRSRRSSRRVASAERAVPWPFIAAAALFVLALSLLVFRPAEPEREGRPSTQARAREEERPVAPRPSAPEARRPENERPLAKRSDPPANPLQPPVQSPKVDGPRQTVPMPEPKPEPGKEDPVAPDEKRDTPPREKSAVAETAKTSGVTIERLEGEVAWTAGTAGARPQPGDAVLVEQGLETRGAKSSAVLKLPDGSRVELRGDTRLDKFAVDQKTFFFARGTVYATVAKQTEGQRLAFRTPQAEATVLGTKLLILISPDATRVEVEEGRVRLRRLSESLGVEIPAGHFALAGKGIVPAVKPLLAVRSFQDGVLPTPEYAGTRDTFISSETPTANAGTADQLRLYRGAEFQCTPLVRWDLSSIPPKSKVVSAELTFWFTGSLATTPARVYELRRPWEESEASWRFASSGKPWQIPGALGEADRGSKSLASLSPSQSGLSTFPLNEAGVAVVQQWVFAPQTNCGILVAKERSEAWDLDSRRWANREHRPKLTVTFIPLAK